MNPGILILLGVGAMILFKQHNAQQQQTGNNNLSMMRQYLLSWINQNGGDSYFSSLVTNTFSAAELSAVYTYIHDYVSQGIRLTTDNSLYFTIQSISSRYNIFT